MVCVKDKIDIYALSNMEFVESLCFVQTLCRPVLSPGTQPCSLFYPDPKLPGQVAVYDVVGRGALSPIIAHKSALVKLAINSEGTWLATASGKVRSRALLGHYYPRL